MKKTKNVKKATAKRKSIPRKKSVTVTRKNASYVKSELKTLSQHILQDYALPLKRFVEQKVTRLQHRFV